MDWHFLLNIAVALVLGIAIGFERLMDLMVRRPSRDAVAVLVEPDVPVPDALEVARELRSAVAPAAPSGAARVVETVRRSGKFGAQLTRLEAAGFSGFVLVSMQDGAVVRGDLRELGGSAEA